MSERRNPDNVAAAFVLIVLVVGGLALLGGVFLGRATKSTKTVAAATTTRLRGTSVPAVAAGAHHFVNFACAQCHGLDGRGGVSPFVPALKGAKALTTAELKQIIDHGAGVSADPKHPYMPVWGQVISDRQVDDLVAYIHAGLPRVPTATPVQSRPGQGGPSRARPCTRSTAASTATDPNGLGGVPNPQSPDKTIPPLSGADFFSEFDTNAKIRDFIVSGSVLGKAPIVSMPHWGGIIPPERLNALVAYIKTLKGKT